MRAGSLFPSSLVTLEVGSKVVLKLVGPDIRLPRDQQPAILEDGQRGASPLTALGLAPKLPETSSHLRKQALTTRNGRPI